MAPPGMNLVMTVIGFGLSVMFIVFVCTRLIIARIYIHASRRSGETRSDLSSILERGSQGLDTVNVANFPTKKYRELCFSSKENHQCTICLHEYSEEDALRILPSCGHSFHQACIGVWLQRNSTCPICRTSLRDPPERKWFMQPMFCSALRSQYNEHHHQSLTTAQQQRCLRCMENELRANGSRAEDKECNDITGNDVVVKVSV